MEKNISYMKNSILLLKYSNRKGVYLQRGNFLRELAHWYSNYSQLNDPSLIITTETWANVNQIWGSFLG